MGPAGVNNDGQGCVVQGTTGKARRFVGARTHAHVPFCPPQADTNMHGGGQGIQHAGRGITQPCRGQADRMRKKGARGGKGCI